MGTRRHNEKVQDEFTRAAEAFSERTKGRFDALSVVDFADPAAGVTVLEVGAGTGNFLSLFRERASRLIALDLTTGMLAKAIERFPEVEAVAGDGARLPFASASIDLVTSAQALHHVWEPVPLLREMRRVTKPGGRVLVVDQVAPESYEQTAFMNHLETIRDPSHATSRPPSTFRVILTAAGLEIERENVWEGKQRLSEWMWPEEYPAERIEAVREAIDKFGTETGMEFERDGDDYVFTRRRIMILARRSE